ncbi:MAG: type 4a pilus biogenesis protein PilO [Candidatus Desulfofervidaceae bacterium]|nr:type 4a pilus biogenesis protein PilO [Candidatus Desulfofervidaceae bacterium]
MLEKLSSIPQSKRVFLYVITFLFGVVLFWYLYYAPSKTEIKQLKHNLEQSRMKLHQFKQAQKELDKLNKEMVETKKKLYEVTQLLPTRKEIPNLLSDISNLGNECHLEFLLFQPGKETIKDFYAEVPVRLIIQGEYLNVKAFLEKLSDLPRVINVAELKMSSPRTEGEKIKLKVETLLLTYRFVPKEERAAISQRKAKKRTRKR